MAQSSQNESTYLVLSSLENGQKYGLEMIESISRRTGGNYIMKKPTLYSALTRMEKKGFVSSTYWGDSELGGKRHYYALTDAGRKELERLSPFFDGYDFSKKDDQTEISAEESATSMQEAATENTSQAEKSMILQQENLFNLTSQQPAPQEVEEEENSDTLDNQLDLFSMNFEQREKNPIEEESNDREIEGELIEADEPFNNTFEQLLKQKMEESKTEQTDDSRFLSEEERSAAPAALTEQEQEQNKKIYDSSAEFRRLSRRKSFSENQIEMAVEYETEEDIETARQRREALKESLLSARQNHYAQPESDELFSQSPQNSELQNSSEQPPRATFSQQNFSNTSNSEKVSQPAEEEEHQDDGVFITSRIEQHEIPIQRKIAPTNLDVEIEDGNLPAPNRNTSIEPTYKDMMSKLFERKKEQEITPVQAKKAQVLDEDVETLADYAALKKYYNSHDIDFKEHIKGSAEINHNTSFLAFVASGSLLLLSWILCSIMFWIFSATGNLNTSTNCFFYIVPIVFLVYFMAMLVRWKLFPNKKTAPLLNGLANWAIFIFGLAVVLIFNIILGMQTTNILDYLTSLLLPAIALFLFFPANYHISKFLFDKYGK